jgi:hypothetical protein
MSKHFRGRLSYANVVATLALFLALAGGTYAALHLPKNSVHSKQVKNDALKGADINEAKLGTVPSANSLGPLHGAAGSVALDGLPGDTDEFMTLGPFTFTLGCQYVGGPVLTSLYVKSARSNTDFAWVVGSDAGSVAGHNQLDYAANSSLSLLSATTSGSTFDLTSIHLVAVAPGITPIPNENLTADLLVQSRGDSSGSDCKVSGTATGT